MSSIDDVPQVRQETLGEGGVAFLFRNRRFRDRASANQARQVEIDSLLARGGAGGGTTFVTPEEFEAASGAPQLAGKEFRTAEQQRAEAELAKQLDVSKMAEVKPPEKAPVTPMEAAKIAEATDQFLTTAGTLLGETPIAKATVADPAVEVVTPETVEAPRATASTVAGQQATVTAAQKEAPSRTVGDIRGQVSPEAVAAAAQAELDPKATVTYQLEQLYKGFKEGETPPAWATPAMRRASAIMQQRGLGASSMAAAAITQAIMESATPIAQADAQAYATIQIANLNNRQQTALSNAATYAAMDTANLNARMTTAVENSRAFLAIDTANLTNEQQANVLTAEAHNQFLLSDQAAQNAFEQLNVQTQAEFDRFFAQLGVQVRENNANRIAAVEQFNAEQTNAIEILNIKNRDLRERFNAEMSAQIQASNAQWKRQYTTINNTNQMLVNEFNAREINNATIRDYNNTMQTYRDIANRIWQTAENNEARATSLAIASLAASAQGGRGSSKGSTTNALIGAAANIGAALITSCHVAQEVYGTETNEWIKFRYWMYHQSPKWFKKFYMKHSLEISKFIYDKPTIKKILRYFMDKQVRKVQWNA